MSIQILEKIFGSSARVKIMRLFLFNPEESFDKTDITKKSKVSASSIQKELNNLLGMGFIKKKSFFKEVKLKSGIKNKRVQGYTIDSNFLYINQIKSLLAGTEPLQHGDVVKKLNRSGKVKLVVLSGLFLQEENSRLDLLLVVDEVKDRVLKNAINILESEVGKELSYAVFSSHDFKYRLGVHDRVVRDVFEYPHQVVIDRLGL